MQLQREQQSVRTKRASRESRESRSFRQSRDFRQSREGGYGNSPTNGGYGSGGGEFSPRAMQQEFEEKDLSVIALEGIMGQVRHETRKKKNTHTHTDCKSITKC